MVFSAILIVAMALFVVGTRLSAAGSMARPLRALRGETVEVRVWGSPLPGGHRIDSVRAAGAGLLVLLQGAGGEIVLLKIAQPKGYREADKRIEIGDARYVQWAGKRLKRVDGVPAVVLAR
jgi:hypothetical protein